MVFYGRRAGGVFAPILDVPCDVLIVEDDDDIREMMSQLIEMEGFAPRTAVNGRDALTQLTQGMPPKVILLDLMMPVMDGREFLTHLHEIPRLAKIPVVVVSAVGSLAPDVKAVSIMRKPVDFARLMDVVEKYCTTDQGQETPAAHTASFRSPRG